MKSNSTKKIVAILNMKGGVGKTTISAHVMRVLYLKLKKRVLLVDFDPQFNLTQAVITQAGYEKLKTDNRTIMSVMEPPPVDSLFTVSLKDVIPPPVQDVATRLKYITDTNIALNVVPGDFRLVKYSLIEDFKVLKPVKQRFKSFIDIASQENDLVCLDCNPSSSFMTMCALEVATHVIIPVRPDRFSIQGLDILDKFIAGLESIPNKPKQIIVINGVEKTNYDSTVEDELRAHKRFGRQTLSTRLFRSKRLEATPHYTGFSFDKPGPYKDIVNKNLTDLAIEIGKELGLTNEE